MNFYNGTGEIIEITTDNAADKESNIIKGEKLIDISVRENCGYSGTLFEQYGTSLDLYDYIDVSENKTLYYKFPLYNKSASGVIGFGCYDAEKNFLYKSADSENVANVSIANNYSIDGIGSDENNTIYSISYNVVTFPDDVKFVRIAESHNARSTFTGRYFLIGRTPVRDLFQTWDDYVSTLSETFVIENDKYMDAVSAPVGVFIGDSLTDWGGGNDAEFGFLKIVHDKTGMITNNEGYAGAWWQTGGGQTYCAVNRVNTIVSEGRKYDLYCFLMGTNAGANTDTGETSADPSTMPGAIRYCLETLKAYDPNAKILVCLPPQRAEGNANQEKVNAVIKTIAESYSVKTLDIYHHSGIVPNTVVGGSQYLDDGLHLGINGRKALGDALAAEIKYMFSI